MKDCSLVSQPQIFNLLLNLRRSSMVEYMLQKYFYHLAFNWYVLSVFYSKEPSISNRCASLSHQNVCSSNRTHFLAVRLTQTFWKTLRINSLWQCHRVKMITFFRKHSGVLDKCYKHIKIRNVGLQGVY